MAETKLSSLRLLESYLEDLKSQVEESQRIKSLGISSSDNDYEIRKTLSKTLKFLERNDDGDNYDELVEQYETILGNVDTIDTKEFIYHRDIQTKPILNSKKSVRFNDNVEEFSKDDVDSNILRPYKDNIIDTPDESQSNELFSDRLLSDEEDSTSIDELSNQEMFIQHQQQLAQQDSHLDILSQSVKRQHGLSIDIHDELTDQNILLDDLESQLDHNGRNLDRGQSRLKRFSRKAREHGQWLTITILVIILVLLLIILK